MKSFTFEEDVGSAYPMIQRPRNENLAAETTDFLHTRIPITRAMGVEVESIMENGITLKAPLQANHNHLGTAFGGSLAAIATLAGYGFLWLRLKDGEAHIVIKESRIRYLHPVGGDIRATCRVLDSARLAEFTEIFERKGKARIQLMVVIHEGDRTCVEFEGEFVAMK